MTFELEPCPTTGSNADFGELIEVRDFGGNLVESIRITADGQYQTSKQGFITPEQLGRYILEASGHPARSRFPT